MTGEPFELVERNGAPRGEKYFVFYNPPVVNRQLGIRRSYIGESRRMALKFIESGLQTLVFANNRLATEVLVTYLKDACDRGPIPSETVRGYRGGYLPRERREIERQLRDGEIRAVVATNALELGIDIGSLDAVVMAGYPGTIASSWQRAGRAGRRQGTSAAVLVASSAPLDQYVVEHPGLFLRPLARARLHQSRQPRNPAGPPEVRGLRAAPARWRDRSESTRPASSAAFSKRAASCTTPPAPGTGPPTAIPPTPPACARYRATISWWSTLPASPR